MYASIIDSAFALSGNQMGVIGAIQGPLITDFSMSLKKRVLWTCPTPLWISVGTWPGYPPHEHIDTPKPTLVGRFTLTEPYFRLEIAVSQASFWREYSSGEMKIEQLSVPHNLSLQNWTAWERKSSSVVDGITISVRTGVHASLQQVCAHSTLSQETPSMTVHGSVPSPSLLSGSWKVDIFCLE